MPPTRSMALGLAAAAVVFLPAAAEATTYCVGPVLGVGCNVPKPGTPGGLQAALTEAESNSEHDSLYIAEGTYVAPTAAGFHYQNTAQQIGIVGAGIGKTILRGASVDNSVALDLAANGSSSSLVRDLTVLKAGTVIPVGLRLKEAQTFHISVDEAAAATPGRGVELHDDAVLRDSNVTLSGGDTGVTPVGASTVRDSTIEAAYGVFGGPVTVLRSTIIADSVGVAVTGPAVTGQVENSRIRMTDDGSGALYAFTGGTLNATNVTLVGEDTNIGVQAFQPSAGTATVNLDSSTVSGFLAELIASDIGVGNAVINVKYSNYDVVGPGNGQVIPGAGNLNVTPGFIGPTPFIDPYHLLHSSPLIDKGNPANPPATTLDLDGLDRSVLGKGAGSPRRDIGAFEYQRRSPAVAVDGPSSGEVGQPLGFQSAGSHDPDPGDTLTYSWSFGGAAGAAGATASHAFTGAGTYAVTLTATDPTGLSASATKQVTITARPPSPPTDPPVGQVIPSDLTAPTIRQLSMLHRRFRVAGRRTAISAGRRPPRGSAFRFRLSERALVRIGVERALTGKRVGGKCRSTGGRVPRRLRCPRWRKTGATLVRRDLAAGRHRVVYTGRVGRIKLAPGLYRASLRAIDEAGNRSKLARVQFRVVK